MRRVRPPGPDDPARLGHRPHTRLLL